MVYDSILPIDVPSYHFCKKIIVKPYLENENCVGRCR